jgi:glycosyltransferase involved in cell wall biosynthesis
MQYLKYTFIVPVHNGGEYLKLCLDSILSQTRDDFDVAILENASNDGTAEWLSFLDDPRIKVYPAKSFLSIEENWKRALQIPKQEFITFICHDDLVDPNYLEVMDQLIRTYPEAGLYHAHFRIINDDGKTLRPCMPRPLTETASQFLMAILEYQRDTFATGYVTRSALYNDRGGIPQFERLLYADFALWMLLMQDSVGATAPEECFSYRMHTTNTTATSTLESHMKALIQFMAFLKNFKERDAEVSKVIESHHEVFNGFFINWYQGVLVQETKKNKKLDPKIREGIKEALSALSPQAWESFSGMRKVRVRELINNNVVARRFYNSYITTRYGKTPRID